MGTRIEWRSRAEGTDYLLKVQEDDGQILSAWEADPELLRDFLNDMTGFAGDGAAVSNNEQDPLGWGRLVLARSEDGDALRIDPELYWGGIAYWFRSRGDDPHPYLRDS